MKSYIKAITYYLPEKILTNDELVKQFPDLKIKNLTRLTGVVERHISAKGETSADLAVKSAEKLFSENSISPDEIDFILFCTQSSDYITPSTACIIQERLNISQSAGAMDFSQGCTGYIYGLSLAKGLIETGSAKNVLLLTAETITKRIHEKDKSNKAIFGDGAAATLISAKHEETGSEIGDFVFGTNGNGYSDIIIKHGGSRYPLKEHLSDDYEDEFGNVRNDSCFYMNGSAVFSFSVEIVPEMINTLLKKTNLKIENIDMFVLHQANRIILETIFQKMKIPEKKSIIWLEKCGNTVSSTIPIALKEAINQGKVKKGDTVLLAGFGVGFSWTATIITL